MSASSTEKTKSTAPATEKRSRNTGGVWVAYDAALTDLTCDSSEIKVLRAATTNGRRVVFWPFGANLAEVVKANEEGQG